MASYIHPIDKIDVVEFLLADVPILAFRSSSKNSHFESGLTQRIIIHKDWLIDDEIKTLQHNKFLEENAKGFIAEVPAHHVRPLSEHDDGIIQTDYGITSRFSAEAFTSVYRKFCIAVMSNAPRAWASAQQYPGYIEVAKTAFRKLMSSSYLFRHIAIEFIKHEANQFDAHADEIHYVFDSGTIKIVDTLPLGANAQCGMFRWSHDNKIRIYLSNGQVATLK